MTCGVRKLFIHLDEFTKQRQSHLSYTPLDMDEFPDCRFISNLLNLFSWHMSDREHRTRHAGYATFLTHFNSDERRYWMKRR